MALSLMRDMNLSNEVEQQLDHDKIFYNEMIKVLKDRNFYKPEAVLDRINQIDEKATVKDFEGTQAEYCIQKMEDNGECLLKGPLIMVALYLKKYDVVERMLDFGYKLTGKMELVVCKQPERVFDANERYNEYEYIYIGVVNLLVNAQDMPDALLKKCFEKMYTYRETEIVSVFYIEAIAEADIYFEKVLIGMLYDKKFNKNYSVRKWEEGLERIWKLYPKAFEGSQQDYNVREYSLCSCSLYVDMLKCFLKYESENDSYAIRLCDILYSKGIYNYLNSSDDDIRYIEKVLNSISGRYKKNTKLRNSFFNLLMSIMFCFGEKVKLNCDEFSGIITMIKEFADEEYVFKRLFYDIVQVDTVFDNVNLIEQKIFITVMCTGKKLIFDLSKSLHKSAFECLMSILLTDKDEVFFNIIKYIDNVKFGKKISELLTGALDNLLESSGVDTFLECMKKNIIPVQYIDKKIKDCTPELLSKIAPLYIMKKYGCI